MSAANNFPSAGAASRNNRTRRNRMPHVVENTLNSRLTHRNANGRAALTAGPRIDYSRLPRAAEPAPAVGYWQLPRNVDPAPHRVIPAVVEEAPRAPKVTPGYGHLDYAKTNLEGKKLSEIGWTYNMRSPGGSIQREYSSFDESGRYIVAYFHVRGEYAMGGVKAYYTLIDNHGQKHQFGGGAGTKPALYLNNELYSRPLPDIVIDQIKLFADLADDSMRRTDPSFSATKYIENLQAI